MARYVISDLHGRFDLYQEVEKFRKTGDKIICLGDCGDRGPQSYEVCKAVADNPDWVLLMGNHEHMTLEALKEGITGHDSSFYTPNAYDVSMYNGGFDTYLYMNEDASWWISYLSKLPYRIDLRSDKGFNLILTHAGFDILKPKPTNWEYVWDRSHLTLPWPVKQGYDDIVMIHGHTPIPILKEDWKIDDGSYFYANGHKIDIDTGSVWTGGTILFNIDTFDEDIFMTGVTNESSKRLFFYKEKWNGRSSSRPSCCNQSRSGNLFS